MPGSASLVWMGKVTLCWTSGGLESSWGTPATCQFSRQKLKKQIYLEVLQFYPPLAAVVAPPNQNLMGTLDGQQHGRSLPDIQGLVWTWAFLSAEQRPEIRKVHRGGIHWKIHHPVYFDAMDGTLHWSEMWEYGFTYTQPSAEYVTEKMFLSLCFPLPICKSQILVPLTRTSGASFQ